MKRRGVGRSAYPGSDPMEVIFAPEATRADVAALYPGARIEPLPEVERGPHDSGK